VGVGDFQRALSSIREGGTSLKTQGKILGLLGCMNLRLSQTSSRFIISMHVQKLKINPVQETSAAGVCESPS
jgi:hypothetical protein